MSAMLLAGFVLCIAMLLTMARMDILKWLGYATIVDVLFTIVMFEMFAGTFMGIVAGAFAGLCMTTLLYVLKYLMGYKRLRMYRQGARMGVHWVYYPGKVVAHVKGL